VKKEEVAVAKAPAEHKQETKSTSQWDDNFKEIICQTSLSI